MQFPYTATSEEKQHVKPGEVLYWMTRLTLTETLPFSLLWFKTVKELQRCQLVLDYIVKVYSAGVDSG